MTEDDIIKRDEVARRNRDALIGLMQEHNLFIPAREFDTWRPTVRTDGQIEGVADGITCIATNGLLGYFLRQDSEPLFGHVQHFKWDKGEGGAPSALFRCEPQVKERTTRKKSKKKSRKQQILDAL